MAGKRKRLQKFSKTSVHLGNKRFIYKNSDNENTCSETSSFLTSSTQDCSLSLAAESVTSSVSTLNNSLDSLHAFSSLQIEADNSSFVDSSEDKIINFENIVNKSFCSKLDGKSDFIDTSQSDCIFENNNKLKVGTNKVASKSGKIQHFDLNYSGNLNSNSLPPVSEHTSLRNLRYQNLVGSSGHLGSYYFRSSVSNSSHTRSGKRKTDLNKYFDDKSTRTTGSRNKRTRRDYQQLPSSSSSSPPPPPPPLLPPSSMTSSTNSTVLKIDCTGESKSGTDFESVDFPTVVARLSKDEKDCSHYENTTVNQDSHQSAVMSANSVPFYLIQKNAEQSAHDGMNYNVCIANQHLYIVSDYTRDPNDSNSKNSYSTSLSTCHSKDRTQNVDAPVGELNDQALTSAPVDLSMVDHTSKLTFESSMNMLVNQSNQMEINSSAQQLSNPVFDSAVVPTSIQNLVHSQRNFLIDNPPLPLIAPSSNSNHHSFLSNPTSLNSDHIYNTAVSMSPSPPYNPFPPPSLVDPNVACMPNPHSSFVVPSIVSVKQPSDQSLPQQQQQQQPIFNPINVARLIAFNQNVQLNSSPSADGMISHNKLQSFYSSFQSSAPKSHHHGGSSSHASSSSKSWQSSGHESANTSALCSDWTHLRRHTQSDRHSHSEGINNRIFQLQQAHDDQSLQLVILQEINQILLMDTEENLTNLNANVLVNCVLDILGSQDEHLIELKNLSCNVLTHLMDALPDTSDSVVPALPILLTTMSSSFVGDILERIINLLEQLSRRHGKEVLKAGGVTTVLGFYDFVTSAQHRTILTMVANCFINLHPDDFELIANCLPSLADHLKESEPRCVERVCTCFARLVHASRCQPEILKRIALSCDLLNNLQSLLTMSPSIQSNVRDVVQIFAILCANCSDLAVDLITLNISSTLYFILTGLTLDSDVNRSILKSFVDISTVNLPPLPHDNRYNHNHHHHQSQSHTQSRRNRARSRSGGLLVRSTSKHQSVGNTTPNFDSLLPFGWTPLMILQSPYSNQTNSNVLINQKSPEDMHALVYLINQLTPPIYPLSVQPNSSHQSGRHYHRSGSVAVPLGSKANLNSAFSTSDSGLCTPEQWLTHSGEPSLIADLNHMSSFRSSATRSSSSSVSSNSSSTLLQSSLDSVHNPSLAGGIGHFQNMPSFANLDPRALLLYEECEQLNSLFADEQQRQQNKLSSHSSYNAAVGSTTTRRRSIHYQQGEQTDNDIMTRSTVSVASNANQGLRNSKELTFDAMQMVQVLLPLLFEIFTEITRMKTRLLCLEAIQRIIFYSSPLLLAKVIHPRLICSCIAGMLNSPENHIILMALQIALMLVHRMPLIFAIHFRKEGILYRIDELIATLKCSNIASDYLQLPLCLGQFNLAGHDDANRSSVNIDSSSQSLTNLSVDGVQSSNHNLNNSVESQHVVRVDTRQKRRSKEMASCESVPHPTEPTEQRQLHRDQQPSLPNAPCMHYPRMMVNLIKRSTPSKYGSRQMPNADGGNSDQNSLHTIDRDYSADLVGIICQQLQDFVGYIFKSFDSYFNKPNWDLSVRTSPQSKGAIHDASPTDDLTKNSNMIDLMPILKFIVVQLESDSPSGWICGLGHLVKLFKSSNGKSSTDTRLLSNTTDPPSPFELNESGLTNALLKFLTTSTDCEIRLWLIYRMFFGSRTNSSIRLSPTINWDLLHSRKSNGSKNWLHLFLSTPDLFATKCDKLSSIDAQLSSEYGDLLNHDNSTGLDAFGALVDCLLAYLHRHEHFHVHTLTPLLPSNDKWLKLFKLDTLSYGSNEQRHHYQQQHQHNHQSSSCGQAVMEQMHGNSIPSMASLSITAATAAGYSAVASSQCLSNVVTQQDVVALNMMTNLDPVDKAVTSVPSSHQASSAGHKGSSGSRSSHSRLSNLRLTNIKHFSKNSHNAAAPTNLSTKASDNTRGSSSSGRHHHHHQSHHSHSHYVPKMVQYYDHIYSKSSHLASPMPGLLRIELRRLHDSDLSNEDVSPPIKASTKQQTSAKIGGSSCSSGASTKFASTNSIADQSFPFIPNLLSLRITALATTQNLEKLILQRNYVNSILHEGNSGNYLVDHGSYGFESEHEKYLDYLPDYDVSNLLHSSYILDDAINESLNLQRISQSRGTELTSKKRSSTLHHFGTKSSKTGSIITTTPSERPKNVGVSDRRQRHHSNHGSKRPVVISNQNTVSDAVVLSYCEACPPQLSTTAMATSTTTSSSRISKSDAYFKHMFVRSQLPVADGTVIDQVPQVKHHATGVPQPDMFIPTPQLCAGTAQGLHHQTTSTSRNSCNVGPLQRGLRSLLQKSSEILPIMTRSSVTEKSDAKMSNLDELKKTDVHNLRRRSVQLVSTADSQKHIATSNLSPNIERSSLSHFLRSVTGLECSDSHTKTVDSLYTSRSKHKQHQTDATGSNPTSSKVTPQPSVPHSTRYRRLKSGSLFAALTSFSNATNLSSSSSSQASHMPKLATRRSRNSVGCTSNNGSLVSTSRSALANPTSPSSVSSISSSTSNASSMSPFGSDDSCFNNMKIKPTITFCIGGHWLPPNIPLFEAIRRFSSELASHTTTINSYLSKSGNAQMSNGNRNGVLTDQEKESLIAHLIWTMSHVIHYRVTYQSSNGSQSSSHSRRRMHPTCISTILNPSLPSTVSSINQATSSPAISKSSNDHSSTLFANSVSLSAAITCLKRRRPYEVDPSHSASVDSSHNCTNTEQVQSRSKEPIVLSNDSLPSMPHYPLFDQLVDQLPRGFLVDRRCDCGDASGCRNKSTSVDLSPGLEMDSNNLFATLTLLHNLNSISRLWYTVHNVLDPFPIFSQRAFQSSKLALKATRQLQDIFSVLAGNLPHWLIQLISVCPFLFPFEIRRTFFFVYNFDRNRTLLRFQDLTNSSISESDQTTVDHQMSSSAHGAASGNDSTTAFNMILNPTATNWDSPNTFYPSSDNTAVLNQLFSTTSSDVLDSNRSTASSSSLMAKLSGRFHLRLALSPNFRRHKVVVYRDEKRLLKQAESILTEMGASHAVLEIAFDNEVGFGLGPTLEFYTLISRQLMKASLGLWHGSDVTSEGYVISPVAGLYPRPIGRQAKSSHVREICTKFYFLGCLLARSLLDCRRLDLPFSPAFFKWFWGHTVGDAVVRGQILPTDVALIDSDLTKHLRQLVKIVNERKSLCCQLAQIDPILLGPHQTLINTVGLTQYIAKHAHCTGKVDEIRTAIVALDHQVDDLCLNFTLPGYEIEMIKNGSHVNVVGSNLDAYIRLVCHWLTIEGVGRQMEALLQGFDSVLPNIRFRLTLLFEPDEMENLFCGGSSFGYDDDLSVKSKKSSSDANQLLDGWDVQTLTQACRCDHGYTLQSRAIRFLFEIMSEFNTHQRRMFVQFLTGSPRLPVGGFRALKPPLKIVMKRETSENADKYLPSVMTCQNYLKLPDYSSKELMLSKLLYAISEGQNAFHLS